MEEELDPFEKFIEELETYLEEYNNSYKSKGRKGLPTMHYLVIGLFIDYMGNLDGAISIDTIPINSVGKSRIFMKQKADEDVPLPTIKKILYKYFEFIQKNYGLINHELMKHLKK